MSLLQLKLKINLTKRLYGGGYQHWGSCKFKPRTFLWDSTANHSTVKQWSIHEIFTFLQIKQCTVGRWGLLFLFKGNRCPLKTDRISKEEVQWLSLAQTQWSWSLCECVTSVCKTLRNTRNFFPAMTLCVFIVYENTLTFGQMVNLLGLCGYYRECKTLILSSVSVNHQGEVNTYKCCLWL